MSVVLDRVPLSEVIKVHYGKALKKDQRDEDGEFVVYGSNGAVGKHSEQIVDFPTLMIGRKGSVGAVHYAPNGGWPIDTTYYVEIKDSSQISLRYLYYILDNSPLDRFTITTSIPGLNRDDLYRTKIPLPPLSEQKRIADILDKADAIRRKRQQVLEVKEQLISAAFLDFFGDPVANSKDWESFPFEQVTTKITDGTHKTPNYQNDGVVFISAKNVKGSVIDWVNTRFISKDEHDQLFRRCNPERGDVLLCKSGTIGRAAEVVVDFPFSLFESLALLKLDQAKLRSTFVVELLNCEAFQRLYKKGLKGVGVKHLHLTDIRKIKVICPPIEIQDQFVSVVSRLRAKACLFADAASESNDLFNSLVQRAFKGEL